MIENPLIENPTGFISFLGICILFLYAITTERTGFLPIVIIMLGIIVLAIFCGIFNQK